MGVNEIAGWAILPGLPGEGPIPHYFHGGHPTPWSEGLVVRFENTDGTAWLGNFQRGSGAHTEIVPWLESGSILVNASGCAYLVNADVPADYCVAGAECAAFAFDSERTMLFVAEGNSVHAYGRDRKVAWSSTELGCLVISLNVSSDSLIVEVEEELGEPLVSLRLSPHDGGI